MSNKIEKIKNYNQVLLALAGTIGIIFLLIGLFFVASEIVDDLFRRDNYYTNNGIIATEETDQLVQDSLRKQVISFKDIQIIDSLTQTYLLPVTQANLADAEYAYNSVALMNTKSIGKSYEKYYGNIYNNLVLYNANDQSSEILFKERISIENFLIHEEGGLKYIVIPACNIDSNKDKFLNDDDLQELFIYDYQRKLLKKIEAQENYTTLRAFQPSQSNDLIVHFGIDRNKNGIFERAKEPMIFYKVNLEDMRLEEFVNEQEITKLQQLLEGR